MFFHVQGCFGILGGATIAMLGIALAGRRARGEWLQYCSLAADSIAGIVFAVGIGLAGVLLKKGWFYKNSVCLYGDQ